MKNFKKLGGLAVVLLALAVCVAPTFAAGDNLKVGDFLVTVAGYMNLEVTDAESAEAAIGARGIRLPDLDLGKDLTQGDVVDIGNAAGLNLHTSTPESPFTSGDAVHFGQAFGTTIGGGADDSDNTTKGDVKVDPRDKGNGLKKGLYKSPSEPI